MRPTRIALLLGSAAAAAVLYTPSSSSAQTTGAPTAIQEVVVTARKREENAQDTPVALSVASGETLANRSARTFIDLQQQTPSLHIVPSALSATTTNLAMRGQALVDIRLNIDPTIAIYQDGVYLPRAQGSNAAELLDIDRVEVLAGPQGTLYGKNSTGGAVSIYTKSPVLGSYEGLVQARAGTYGDYSLGAVANLPLGQTSALRLVGNYSGRTGYGTNAFNGDDNGWRRSKSIRASFRTEPSDALRITLRGDYTQTKAKREAYKGFVLVDPLTPGVGLGGPPAVVEAALEMNGLTLPQFLGQAAAVRNAQLATAYNAIGPLALGGDPDDNNANLASAENAKIYGASATIDYDFTDWLSGKSITGFRGFRRFASQDLDGTPFSIIEYPHEYGRDRQFSEEAQLLAHGFDNRLTAQGGLYYSSEKGREEFDQVALRLVAGPASPTFQRAKASNESFGLFTQGTFKFTDQLSATAGVRHTHDKRELTANNYTSVNCLSLGVPMASLANDPARCVRPMSISFDQWSYTASLEYKVLPDVLIYAKTNKGYRSGGLQETASGTSVAQANIAYTPFQPETVTDYELGLKSEWFDRRLRFNLDYFHSKLKDAIRTVSTPVPGTTTVAANAQNAAQADVDGVEWEVTAVPVTGLEISTNGAWNDAKFKKYITPTGEDRSYLPLLFTPKWQVGASVAYTAETAWGRWRTQADYSFTGRQLTAESRAYSPAHELVNARSSLTIESIDTTVSVFGKNLINERYILFPVDVGSLGGAYASLYNPPRTFGVEVEKRF